MTRIALISEDLAAPLDEGVKKLAHELGRALSAHGDVVCYSVPRETRASEVARVSTADRLFLRGELIRSLERQDPAEIYYVPSPSATPATLLRSRSLARRLPAARIAVLAHQPRTYPFWFRPWIPRLAPDVVLVLSPESERRLRALGLRTALVPAGVDPQRFVPAPPGDRENARRALALPAGGRLLLHVGHLSPYRNPSMLIRIARETDFTPVLVASTSTPEHPGVRRALEDAGCLVLRRYFERIEDLYRLADLYLFPVHDAGGCIEFPLSVLEAMACGLPVLSRPFGGLPHFLPEDGGIRYYQSGDEAIARLQGASGGWGDARSRAEAFGWDRAASEAVAALRGTREGA
jgi:glycosyltransferase involved in cell wall biosynthesis